MKTTNYYNTFIEVAEDCPISNAEVPPTKAEKTVANLQFEMIYDNPYKYTSDDVLFHVYALKQGIKKSSFGEERAKFFSKGQACFRASPLTKRYGWGVHADEEGKIALYELGSPEYNKFLKQKDVAKIKAMRSARKK